MGGTGTGAGFSFGGSTFSLEGTCLSTFFRRLKGKVGFAKSSAKSGNKSCPGG